MKSWRDSASLILAARHGLKCKETLRSSAFQYDYKLLFVKRSKNATYMPEQYVFPGGVIEQSDADMKWNKLFSTFGFNSDSFLPLLSDSSTRPAIFKTRRNELPREISLRITAIRETFEECGILMCKHAVKKGSLTEWAEHFVSDQIESWQEKVHNDSTEFYRMCEMLKCYPDLWALHEWSNWMSPTHLPKRFDTIFYIACMPTQPPTHFDNKEMEDLKWENPNTILSATNACHLAPPQYYEMARIGKFECLDNLLDFAVARSKIGLYVNLPVKIRMSDGYVFVLPGDSMYPEDVSLTDKQILDRTHMTIEELREVSPIRNRYEFYNVDVKTIRVDNFSSKDGHLSPFPVETVKVKPTKG